MRVPLENRVAIVTGASRGIGAAITEVLAGKGATVIASALADDPPDRVAGTLRARGLDAWARIADVTDPDEVQSLADWTKERFGRIDVLVNNAGTSTVAPTAELYRRPRG